MKYASYLILILLLGSAPHYGQSAKDTVAYSKSLQKWANSSEISNKDIDKMLEITEQSWSAYPDFTLRHLGKIRTLIVKNQHLPAFVAYVNQIVFIYSGKGEIREAEKILTEVYKEYEDDLDPDSKAAIQFQFATVASELGQYDESMKILEDIDSRPGTPAFHASIHFQKGLNLHHLGDLKKALTHSLKAVDLYKSIGNKTYLSAALDLINIIYQKLGDFEKALVYSKQALEHALQVQDIDMIMHTYSNMGIIYKETERMDSAIYAYEKAIEMGKRYERPIIVAQNLLNLGNIFANMKRYSEAENHFLKSLDICREFNLQEGVVMNYINLGSNQFTAENYAKSEVFYKKALEESQKTTEIPEYLIPIYGGLTDIYEIKGDYKNAFEYFKKYQEITDKINIEQAKSEIAEIQGKYDTALKDVEIAKINKDFEIKKSENKALIYLILVGVVLTASIILFLIYRNNQLKILYKKNIELLHVPQFLPAKTETESESGNPLSKVFEEIIHLLEKEKAYQNPNLTINDVTQGINSNQKYVSLAISNYTQMNFNNFVNYFRINEAKKHIISQEYQTLNEIMYACGFNSRTPFYNAFNKFTGMSPKQFKDLSKSQPEPAFERKMDVLTEGEFQN